jgi:Asp-tRNA(Asn)/Glu-tRNA(Gln) amidotransferase A subunit family amidase
VRVDPFWSAVELAAAIRARRTSASQLVELYLERIARHNPALNAVCTLDQAGASRKVPGFKA